MAELRKIHFRLAHRAYACGVGRRWWSQTISSTTSRDLVTCCTCMRILAGREAQRFVYRNRADDDRTPDQLYYCRKCGGYYGVPHEFSHCQREETATWLADQCACRFCREATGKPIEGAFGYFLSDAEVTS